MSTIPPPPVLHKASYLTKFYDSQHYIIICTNLWLIYQINGTTEWLIESHTTCFFDNKNAIASVRIDVGIMWWFCWNLNEAKCLLHVRPELQSLSYTRVLLSRLEADHEYRSRSKAIDGKIILKRGDHYHCNSPLRRYPGRPVSRVSWMKLDGNR